MLKFKIRPQGERLMVDTSGDISDCEIFLMEDGQGDNRYITVCAYHAHGNGYDKLFRLKPNGFAYRCKNVPPNLGFKIDGDGKLRFSNVPFCGEVG